MKRAYLGIWIAAFLFQSPAPAQQLERREGYIPMLWDESQGKLFFELTTQFNKEILYYTNVAQGSGSGSVGFEWAGEGEGGVIEFQRVGSKVLVLEKNVRFRPGSGGPGMEQGVGESFPDSMLAALPITKVEGDKVTVDAMPLLIRDAVGFTAPRAGRGGGGLQAPPDAATTWRFDPARCAVYLSRTKGFPKNTEVEVTVTYEAQSGGARTTPESRILTGRLHHTFLEAPTGYTPREADWRVGVGSIRYADYSKSYSDSHTVELVRRQRLEKKDPDAAVSEPKEPLTYYLDPAVPEPIRSAIKDGVGWWNKSFEAAGFKNAVVVRDAPLEMDPMDIRYKHIFWVDRDERGYSTGGGLTDPRTGEIIAARVRLESDRVRTASRYWQSYMPGASRSNNLFLPPLPLFATYSSPDTEDQLVLLRQALLAAHEVGHSLGFEHNWTSSANDRASVMEYPSPRIKLVNGRIDLSDAYQKEIGAYDTIMVRYAYSVFPPGKEKAGLEGVIADMRKAGLTFTPGTDPRWNRYDDLSDPAEYLRQTYAQRKVLLAGYGPNVLRNGEPYGNLRGMRLWMVYLHHRWAIDSGVKYVGGMFHNYAVKGDSIPPTEIVTAARQREILNLLCDALDPASLAIPEKILASLTVAVEPDPGAAGGGRRTSPDLENFEMPTGYAFDQLTAARTLAGLIIGQLLEPDKAARLISFADRQQGALTLPEVLQTIENKVWDPSVQGGMNKSLQRQSQRVFVDALMMLGANNNSTPDVKAVVMAEVNSLHGKVAGMKDSDPVNEAHLRAVERDLNRFIQNPATAPRQAAPPPPVMAPI
jgi:Met-zincin/Domain of unknown function (DUF5117)